MDIQYVIVYLVVAFAAWQLLKRFVPQKSKKKKEGAACSACSACEPAGSATPDWMAVPRPGK